jgi:thiol-disulfide isomerase/thioredoxin
MHNTLKPQPGAVGRPPRARVARAALSPAVRAPIHPQNHHSPTRRPPLPPPRGILDAFRAAAGEEDDNEEDGDDADACPVDCVAEIATPSDLDSALSAAASLSPATLVVVDFYKTSCGACRYIAPGFVKLCKAAGKGDAPPDVIFLKHNVLDEEDGRTELAVRESVRAVPTFHFYVGGERVEAFPTRDRAVIAAAVNRLVGREVL